MDYTASIPDEREPCITAARLEYNNSIPQEVDGPEGGMIPNPDLKADNAAYMAWVMDNATKSYCSMYFPRVPEGGLPDLPEGTPAPAAAT